MNPNTLPARRASTKPETLKAVLAMPEYQARFREILGERSGQFVASLVSIGRTMPDVEPVSIVMAAMTAAALDLPVDKNLGFAWIIPYREGDRKYAQFQMGYKGYIQLALRSNVYQRMNAVPVNKEAFGGYDEVGEPIILWDKVDESKPAYGYAFAYKLVNGFVKCAFWTKDKVIEHAKRYSSAYRKGSDTPWKTHFDQMALKTVIKNALGQWGILSVQMEGAMRHDGGIRRDLEATIEFPDGSDDAPPAPKAPALENVPAPKTLAPGGPASQQGEGQPVASEPRMQPAQEPIPTQAPQNTGIPFAPNPKETDALNNIRYLLHQHGKTEDELLPVLRAKKLAKDDQRLEHLAESKLTDIGKKFESVFVPAMAELEKVKT